MLHRAVMAWASETALKLRPGHEVDAIIGATAMEKWEILLNPKTGELDLEGLRRREFTEYLTGDV